MQAVPPNFNPARAGLTTVLVVAALIAVLFFGGCGVTYNTLPLSVDPSSVTFGSVQVGNNATATVTIRNSSLKSVTFSGIQSADAAFTVGSSPSSVTLPAGASASVQLVFAPTSVKNYSAKIVVVSSAGQTAFQATGAGVQASTSTTSAALALSASALQFGSVPVGKDAQQTMTLTSTGTAPLIITSLTTSGTGFSAQVPSLPLTLAPQESLSVPVAFVPATTGAASGQLMIGSNAAVPSATVALAGDGGTSTQPTQPTPPPPPPPPTPPADAPVLSLSSSAIDFGAVAVGSQGGQLVVLSSTGTAAVVIHSLTVSGNAFGTGVLTMPLTLAPGQQITLPVTFAPIAAGSQQGEINLTDNTAAGQTTLSLSGQGTTTSTLSVPQVVNFGDVTDGSSDSQTVTLVASGTAPVTVESVGVTGSGFTVPSIALPQVLQPNQQLSVKVNFAPAADGSSSGQLAIISNAATDPAASVTLQGAGVPMPTPALSASATTLSFGKVVIDTTATQTFTVTSTGTAPATITAGTLSGSGYAVTYAGVGIDSLVSFTPVTLQPGQKAVFQVTFDPSQPGASSGQLSLATDTGSPITVTLNGQGTAALAPAVTLSASSLDFGDVEMGKQATQQLTLSSTGTAPLTISSSSIVGRGFQIASVGNTPGAGTWPMTLAAGQQLVLTIAFNPDAVTAFTGSLALVTNASGGSVNVPLSGNGDAVPVASLHLSSSAISFGSVTLGSSASQSLTVSSTGSAPLVITSLSVTGSAFTASQPDLPVTLQPGQQLSLPLTFTPNAAEASIGTLTLLSNASTGSATVALGGTGTVAAVPAIKVSASTLNFGSVTQNSSATQTLTLSSSGNAPLKISAISVSGLGFSIAGADLPATLNPGQTLQLSVTFDPASAGNFSGLLSITSNAAGGTNTSVSLAGAGAVPVVTPSPMLQTSVSSLPFGSVAIGSTSTLNLTLLSSGTAPLTISSLGITGSEFSQSGGTFPVTLSPGQSVAIEVQFDPSTTGAALGTLTIASNSSNGSTTQIPISGTGAAVPHTVELNWNAPASSSDPAVGYNIYRSTNGASKFTQLNSTVESDTTYTDKDVQSGATYLYQVTSVDESGAESVPSNQITLSIP